MRAPIVAALALLFAAGGVHAQDPRLTARFQPVAARAIAAAIDEASAAGLPTEPLIQKALEGATKGAAPDLIERAVRSLAGRMESARERLGTSATEAELVAAASALFAGATPSGLARLRALRPNESLAMPLVALAFFMQHGVTTETSARWIESLVGADVGTEDLLRLQQSIDADIRSGAAASSAGATRVEALLRRRSEGQR